MVRSAPMAWLTRRLLAAVMLLLASSPHVASAAEAIDELNEVRPAPCCPAHPVEAPERAPTTPDDPRDCSRTCRSCHCCLPVVWFGASLPEVAPAPRSQADAATPAPLGADRPAHTRGLFRPPAA